MKTPSIRSRAAIAVAAIAILTAGLSGATSAAAGGPATHHAYPVPAPYPGARADRSTSPSAPVTISGELSPEMANCTPTANGDYVHVSSGDASGHGWWLQGNCPYTKSSVTVQLNEWYSDNSWHNKNSATGSVYPGGGAGNRVTARQTCVGTTLAGWRSVVTVWIGWGNTVYTTGQNIYCTA